MVANFTNARMPDETYRDFHAFEQGVRFELRHGKGETDDHTGLIPSMRAICAGDSSSAARTRQSQKQQRYPAEWAVVLREMARWAPRSSFPATARRSSADRIRQAIEEIVQLLNRWSIRASSSSTAASGWMKLSIP
jgi:predicted RNase H-like nuclease